jgi:hypothetical protein
MNERILPEINLMTALDVYCGMAWSGVLYIPYPIIIPEGGWIKICIFTIN